VTRVVVPARYPPSAHSKHTLQKAIDVDLDVDELRELSEKRYYADMAERIASLEETVRILDSVERLPAASFRLGCYS